MLFKSENPQACWQRLGQEFLRKLAIYTSWISPQRNALLKDKVTTVEEVRQQGFFQVLTTAQCLEQADSGTTAFILHPLAAGVPIAEAWQYLRLFGEPVMPGLG